MEVKILEDIENKYFDLVWYARVNPDNLKIPKVSAKVAKIEKLYPTETNHLKSEMGNWEHGFNSGMLAAVRYFLELKEYGRKSADLNFPNLDS